MTLPVCVTTYHNSNARTGLNPNELDHERCTLVLMKGIKSDAAVRHALSANQAIHTRPSYAVDLHDGDDGWWQRQCKLCRK